MNANDFTIGAPAPGKIAAINSQPVKVEQSIVCGTDFSENSARAVEVAAAIAKRLGEQLMLVHAGHGLAHPMLPENLRESLCLYERSQLYHELETTREKGVDVVEIFETGSPEEIIQDAAGVHHARMIVISSHSARHGHVWGFGNIAIKIAESSPVPTLVVRNTAPFEDWLGGKRALRVFAAIDLSEASMSALRWLQWLGTLAKCELNVSMFYSEPPTANSSDTVPMPSKEHMRLAAERTRERYFRLRVREILGPGPIRIRVENGRARSDIHLLHSAEIEKADLIVVGTRQLHGLSRLMSHSFSRGILHYAKANVVCVPSMHID